MANPSKSAKTAKVSSPQSSNSIDSAASTVAPNRFDKLISKLKRLKGAIVAIAGVGAVASGFVGYYTTYKTVTRTTTSTSIQAANLVSPLSIMVMPFANQTGDLQKAYVVEAVTANITTDLSRIQDAYVVPVETAQKYKDKSLSLKEIGVKVDARFIFHGNLQANGNKIRVNAHLLDNQSDTQLWSETFDGELTDLFALQEKMTARIRDSVGSKMVILAARESEMRKSSPRVIDLMLRATALSMMPDFDVHTTEIETLYRQALVLEPSNVRLMMGLATTLMPRGLNAAVKSPAAEKWMAEARELALKVRAIDPENARVYDALGDYALFKGDRVEALRNYQKFAELSPNNPMAYNNLANLEVRSGDAALAISLLERALFIRPKGHPWYFSNLSRAYLMLGNNDAAIQWGLKANDTGTKMFNTAATLAMAYSNKGDVDNARIHAAEFHRLEPDYPGIATKKVPINATAAYFKYFETRYVPEWKKAGLP